MSRKKNKTSARKSVNRPGHHSPKPVQSVPLLVQGDAITDGYLNAIEHAGRWGSYKSAADVFIWDRLSWRYEELLKMYRGSWLVGMLIDSIAEDMFQYGVTFTGSSLDPDLNTKLQNNLTNLGIWDTLIALVKKGRLFGGAIAAIDIYGQDWDQPLNLETIAQGTFQGLRVFERWYVRPSVSDLVPKGLDVGLPKFYEITTQPISVSPEFDWGRYEDNLPDNALMAGDSIHHTRAIRSIGVELTYIEQVSEQYWGMSILERYQHEIYAYHKAYGAYANMLSFLGIRVLKLADFKDILASGQPSAALANRIQSLDTLQSNANLTVIAMEDDFSIHQFDIGRYEDIFRPILQPIAAGEDIPLVILYGESPKGMNATGKSDRDNWAESIKRRQENLREYLRILFKVNYCSVTGELPPPDFDFEFVPLIPESRKEQAEVAYGITKTVVTALEAGIISPSIAARELSQQNVFKNLDDDHIEELEEMDNVPMYKESNQNFVTEDGNTLLGSNKKQSDFENPSMRGSGLGMPHSAPGVNGNL